MVIPRPFSAACLACAMALSALIVPGSAQAEGGLVVVNTITADSSEGCNQLCMANADCLSADYGSPGGETGSNSLANDRSCIMYGHPAVRAQVAPAPVPAPAPVVIAAAAPQVQVASGGGEQYQVYIKAAQCRFLIKGQECEYSTRGSIHLIFHGSAGTSQQDVIWKVNGLRAGMADTVTVNSNDVGDLQYVSFFVPGKDTFKPEMIVVNKLSDGVAPGSNGVYFTESELLMSESLLEPHELHDVGRYYYRYPLYRSTCTKQYSSLTDWFLKCRPNRSPTPAPQMYCGDIEINPLKDYWLIEQKADSGAWRYFDVNLGGLSQALTVEVLPQHDATLEVILCPHCPKDGECQGVQYGQYGAYENRNFMNLTRTSLGQRKMWTAVPPALQGASYRVGVNDPDLVRMSDRWFVAVRSSGGAYDSVYYKIRARLGMAACTRGLGTGALVNGRGQDDYLDKMKVEYGSPEAAAAAAYRKRKLTFEELMQWQIVNDKTKHLRRRLLEAQGTACGGKGHPPCTGSDFCDFSAAGSGFCKPCEGGHPSTSKGHEAFNLKCGAEAAVHSVKPSQGAQCGGTHVQCTGTQFCNFDSGHEGHCVGCESVAPSSIAIEIPSTIGQEAFHRRCQPGTTKDDDDKDNDDAHKKSNCGGHFGACTGSDEFCSFSSGESGECEHCTVGNTGLTNEMGKMAFAKKCAAGAECSHHTACTGAAFCNFGADGVAGNCRQCASVPAGEESRLSHLAQTAHGRKCKAEAEVGVLGSLGGSYVAPSLPPAVFAQDANHKVVQCGGSHGMRCEGLEFCTFHTDGGKSGVCRLCSTMPDCTKVMYAKGQAACKAKCQVAGAALGGSYSRYSQPAAYKAPAQADKQEEETYAEDQASAYDQQQEVAEATYMKKQTDYEAVHNEPYACPLYVDYPTLDVNLGSHGQRPAIVDAYTEQCPGIDEAWCKQTHYMCDADNRGLAMKPAPLICAAMAEGWDSYGMPFGCASLSYSAQKLIYEVACDLGPGPQLYGLANAESSSPNLVAKSNFGYHYTFPRHERPPIPCEPIHFACETPECYLSARPLGCMCHQHRIPECRMVDDDDWARYRQMGFAHSNQYHIVEKKTIPKNTQIRGKYVAKKQAYNPYRAKVNSHY